MTMNSKAVVVAALTAVAMGGVQAALNVPGASSLGNASVLFAAHDANDQITLIVDLGLNMIDFIEGAPIHTPGTQVSWNFATNTVTGANITGNAWSTAYDLFKSTQSGNDFRWSVFTGDAVTGPTVTASNAIAGRGYMATGNPTAAQLVNVNATTSSPIGVALGVGNMQGLYAVANNLGNIATAENGAGTTTGGNTAYGVLGGNFLGSGAWSYFMANGETSAFTYLRQIVANPVAYQFGETIGIDELSANPSTFRFDINTNTLTWLAAPVPEPGTYALMLAGIAGLTFVARRRRG